MKGPEEDRDLTARELADRLGVPLRTVHNWVKAGRLVPKHKLPGRTGPFLFDKSAADIRWADPGEEST